MRAIVFIHMILNSNYLSLEYIREVAALTSEDTLIDPLEFTEPKKKTTSYITTDEA